MKSALKLVLVLIVVSPSYGQKVKQATTYDFPKPVDTQSREIQYQKKQIFSDTIGDVYATNDFPAARLNDFTRNTDQLYVATINPENTPINTSPWYAFKIWSKEEKNVWIQFVYPENGRHRYVPKLSNNGERWEPADNATFTFLEDGSAVMNVSISADTLWIAAQEILDSRRIGAWASELAKNEKVTLSTIGKSKAGRDLIHMDLNNGKTKKKEVIAIFSRQHPPEISGFKAMQSFLDELIVNKQSDAFFKKYRVVVYPLINPDGVDLGHWRHNTGGIDLNRDWAYYNQPETRQVADHLVYAAAKSKAEVILGIDFHSTQKDVFYTIPDDVERTVIPNFKTEWLKGLEDKLSEEYKDYKVNEEGGPISTPVTKFWFYTQFDAEGVTYEVGDETPRVFIDKKARVAADVMMRLLLEEN
ncbi:MAG: M14 family metallopeptidase [Bacteroidota bacterium]